MKRPQDHKLNVIIADDDMDDQLFMQKAIWEENRNHTITSVYNGQQLVDLLLNNGFYDTRNDTSPDCIFLDLKMPLLNGFDVLTFIKNDQKLNKIPVYILSTSMSETQKLKLILLGADGFYQKASGYDGIKNTINDILYMIYSTKGIRM
ncbi:MAG: response regulator [Bacteroidetes bacterium]|nr:response regulator [Bacteroidota bacterium]